MDLSLLTLPLEYHIAIVLRRGREDKGVVVRFVAARLGNTLPRIRLNMNMRLRHLRVLVEEMLRQQQSELLGTLDAVFLGQQIDGVLLRVGGHNVRVVALEVVLVAVQLQVGTHLELLYAVHRSLAIHIHHLHGILAVSLVGDLVLLRRRVLQ